MSIIVCNGITKRFRLGGKPFEALSDIGFSLMQGELTGLLGPDGAGKTTLLRILAGLLRPEAGKAGVLGFDTVREAARIQSVIGYMPQKFGLYENLTLLENLKLYADLHAVPYESREKRFAELLEMTDLSRFPNRPAGKLSGGMKQKLALACSLISEPELMLLDEPTVGVDVLSRRELWHILRNIAAERNTTVLVSTSYMDEANFCDRVLVLFKGELIADGIPDDIRQKADGVVANPTFEQGFQMMIAGAVPPPLKRLNPPTADAPVMIHAENLVKKFGSFTAVDHISFEVGKGEIFGLLGANGAGKTTTFRMLCGLDAATAGNVRITGLDLRHAPGEARNRIGFVAQKFSLYSDLTLQENLEFFGGAYGLWGKHLRQRITWALEEFSLKTYFKSQTANLPLGIKQRLSMACALLHEPEVLFLDEATSGADPITRRDFWARIMKLADDGVAVIITTHFLDEAEYCDRMIIMHDGKAVAAGTATEIRRTGTPPDQAEVNLEEAFVNIIRQAKSAEVPK
jgi:ABC-2 type transport system ATP-binding protein